ncbi:Glyoxalase-like domain protein [Bremerella volcania]|uniref:Glyoxalase-like domain protein n=1 Tax=Bremerella volcania TaxID=2527984 RepID=A0A518CD27_9BACT|nr:VOC family protein [Bremerella volcania]QDU77126.1 Glyoxalase-like domain protein [Bremerella volcania]
MELFAVEIRTAQWQPMILWYTAALNMKAAVRSAEEGYALLAGRGWRLSLLELQEDEPRDHSAISLALEVEDLAVARERIEPYLMEPSTPIEMSEEGFLQWGTTDPDGNRIKLFQFVAVD